MVALSPDAKHCSWRLRMSSNLMLMIKVGGLSPNTDSWLSSFSTGMLMLNSFSLSLSKLA